MIKSAIIFQDTDGEKTYRSSPLLKNDFREIIKEAYHEGRRDALHEQKKATARKNKNGNRRQKEKEEAINSSIKEEEQTKHRLKTLTTRQEVELLRAYSVFPFSLFTDTLIIDTTKVTIIKKQFFATEYIVTIPLKDLSDTNVQTFLFLGSLTVEYMPQSNSPGMMQPIIVRIANLRRAQAIRAKNILKGILVTRAEDIDIATLTPQEVVDIIEKFGESRGVM